MAWDSSQYPADWPQISEAVKERDRHRCQMCGAGKDSGLQLHAHHLVRLSVGGTSDLHNLVTLCENCHANVHPHMRRKTALYQIYNRYSFIVTILFSIALFITSSFRHETSPNFSYGVLIVAILLLIYGLWNFFKFLIIVIGTLIDHLIARIGLVGFIFLVLGLCILSILMYIIIIYWYIALIFLLIISFIIVSYFLFKKNKAGEIMFFKITSDVKDKLIEKKRHKEQTWLSGNWPKRYSQLCRLSAILRANENYASSLQALREAKSTSPQRHEAWFESSITHFLLNDLEEARHSFVMALKRNSDLSDHYEKENSFLEISEKKQQKYVKEIANFAVGN